MTLSFIAFHMADYQRDTMQLPLEGHGAYFLLLQHCWTHGRIPADDDSCAAICKVPVQRWRKQLAPLVAGYFDADGCNKRATVEIAKAEKIRTRQAMAGHKGGEEKARRKALQDLATAKPRLSHGVAAAEPRSSHGVATLEKKDSFLTSSSFLTTARASENDEKPPENPPNQPETQSLSAVSTPQGFAMEARKAVQADTGIVSGELVASIQARRWVP